MPTLKIAARDNEPAINLHVIDDQNLLGLQDEIQEVIQEDVQEEANGDATLFINEDPQKQEVLVDFN